MRRVSIVSGLFVLCILAIHSSASADAPPDIIIGEVQIAGASANDEFIELRNTTDHAIDIAGWKLRKRIQSGTESSIKDFSTDTGTRIDIPADGYLLWANSGGSFASLTDVRFTSGTSLTDNNSLALFDENGGFVDAITYGTGHKNPFLPSAPFTANPAKHQSLVRDPDTLSLSLSSAPSPEHDAVVIVTVPEEAPDADPIPESGDIAVRINELFPDPKEGGEKGEFIELRNLGDRGADVSGFVLRDASKSGKYVLPEGSVIAANGYLIVSRAESGLSLNNTDETVFLSDPSGNPVDSASYGSTKEEASYSHDGSSFRWSRYLTPAAPNRFGDAPSSKKTDIPKKAYKDVPTVFSASGSGDRKYFWDFGDGGTSRKQEASHTYEESGEYAGTLTISEGIEETVKTFVVDVEKFPKRKVSIAAVSANPTGDDAESEWISLRNKDKKKVDLLGWSIATGSSKKKLSDHPIRESFVLKPGEERAVTREIAAFSLPNKKGYVELRQPDGKVLAKTSYTKEGGIEENEVWRKQDGGSWTWAHETLPNVPDIEPVAEQTERETEEPAPVTPPSPEPETPRTVTLDDLSPEDLARLEAQAEEKVRRRIFAELLEKEAAPAEEEGTVLGVSDERGGGYSGTIFRTINQALNGILSKK